jgi:starvation-inducible DNA-binding protein
MSKKTADLLNNLLSNYYALFTKTQGYHWNITGSHFLDLHNFFQEQYEFMFKNIDEIAERMRALKAFAPAGLDQLHSISKIKDGKINLDWHSITKELELDHKQICTQMYQLAKECEEDNDLATVDLMTRLISEHEKQIWILHSMLAQK